FGQLYVYRNRLDDQLDAPAALVSIIIPCYNQAHFLGEAIESVLAQSHSHHEIVVIDDGSTDNTRAVAGRYPGIRYIRQVNCGLSAARNTGLRCSQGDYIVFLDADDRLFPQALRIGLESLTSHPECMFAAGRYELMSADGSCLGDGAWFPIEDDHYAGLLL